jgi:hypothetical protein
MADESISRRPRFTSMFFATAAIICFSYGAFALTLLHFLRPDYAPASNFISNYAVGPYGWIMTTWFLAMSCGLLTLVLALAKGGMRSIVGWLGLSLLFVASLGLVVSAIFPTDVPGAPSTRAGDIHDTSFLVNVGSIITATVLISAGLGGMPRMRKFRSNHLDANSIDLGGICGAVSYPSQRHALRSSESVLRRRAVNLVACDFDAASPNRSLDTAKSSPIKPIDRCRCPNGRFWPSNRSPITDV